jgi:hypothetical protein
VIVRLHPALAPGHWVLARRNPSAGLEPAATSIPFPARKKPALSSLPYRGEPPASIDDKSFAMSPRHRVSALKGCK